MPSLKRNSFFLQLHKYAASPHMASICFSMSGKFILIADIESLDRELKHHADTFYVSQPPSPTQPQPAAPAASTALASSAFQTSSAALPSQPAPTSVTSVTPPTPPTASISPTSQTLLAALTLPASPTSPIPPAPVSAPAPAQTPTSTPTSTSPPKRHTKNKVLSSYSSLRRQMTAYNFAAVVPSTLPATELPPGFAFANDYRGRVWHNRHFRRGGFDVKHMPRINTKKSAAIQSKPTTFDELASAAELDAAAAEMMVMSAVPAVSVVPGESVVSAVSEEPAVSAVSAVRMQSMKPMQSMQPVNPVNPVRLARSLQPMQPMNPMRPVKLVRPAAQRSSTAIDSDDESSVPLIATEPAAIRSHSTPVTRMLMAPPQQQQLIQPPARRVVAIPLPAPFSIYPTPAPTMIAPVFVQPSAVSGPLVPVCLPVRSQQFAPSAESMWAAISARVAPLERKLRNAGRMMDAQSLIIQHLRLQLDPPGPDGGSDDMFVDVMHSAVMDQFVERKMLEMFEHIRH